MITLLKTYYIVHEWTLHSVGDWVTITGWPKPTYQGVCEINISKIQPIQQNEYIKIANHGLTAIMEHEYYTSKDILKAENISFENMNYTENNQLITETSQHESKNPTKNENENTNNAGIV